MSQKEFSFQLHSPDDIKTFLDKVLDFEEKHIAGNFENLIYTQVYYDLKVCLEECIFNAFKHGYKNKTEKPAINVTLNIIPNGLKAEIVDNAEHFNLLKHQRQNEDEKDGIVIGLNLIEKLSDNIEYEQLENGNKVTIERTISY